MKEVQESLEQILEGTDACLTSPECTDERAKSSQ